MRRDRGAIIFKPNGKITIARPTIGPSHEMINQALDLMITLWNNHLQTAKGGKNETAGV